MKIAAQTPRWCQLATTLWSLTVLESPRNADRAGLAQFLEVISWRATGKITEEEFSILYSEWMMASETPSNATPSKNVPNSPTKAKKTILGVGVMRSLLMERGCAESDLDLFIGMIINEANLRLLNATISYVNNKVNKNLPSFSLEVVTPKWLSLSEELFFSLDTPGYGVWRFDEALFFSACVAAGLQGWRSENELEADLSIATLTTMTLQFMRDAGAFLTLSSTRNSATDPRENNRPWQRQKNVANHPKQEITLVMFKRYLIRRNVGENELVLMVQHLKFCVEKVVKLVKMNGADDFFVSFQPLEHRGNVIGSPRMWQESVMVAAGLSPSVPPHPIPPVLLFLLTDAEKFVTGAFRGIEFLVDGNSFIDVTDVTPHYYPVNETNTMTNPLLYYGAANDELQENAYRIWNHFQKWGRDDAPALNALTSGLKKNSADLQRDPVYQLILNALLQYKKMQQVFNAAMFDFSINQYGSCPVNGNAVMVGSLTPPNPLSILCAGLTPNNRKVLAEFGLVDSSEELPMDDLGLDSPTKDEADSVLDPAETHFRRSNDSKRHIAMDNESEMDDDSAVAAPSIDESVEIAYENPNEKRFKKISELPLANKRRTNLLNLENSNKLSNSQMMTGGSSKAVVDKKLSTLESQKSRNSDSNLPNYFKPTLTSMAKKPSRSDLLETESSSEQSVASSSNAPPINKSAKKFTPTPVSSATFPPAKNPNEPDWISMLDFRNKQGAASSSSVTVPAPSPTRQNPTMQQHSNFKSVATPQQTSQHRPVLTQSQEMQPRHNEKLALSEQEAHIVSQLLVATDPNVQAQLVEKLRRLKLGPGAAVASNNTPAASRQQKSTMSATVPLTSAALSRLEQQENDRLKASTAPMHHNQPNSPTASDFLVNQLNDDVYDDALQETRSDHSSIAPSSIQELLQQGHSPGRYAQMLRDILRKMSKDDSQVRLKSLEQIIKLGENIVQESADKKKTAGGRSTPPPFPQTIGSNSSSRRSLGAEAAPSTERRSRSANPMRKSEVLATPAPMHHDDHHYLPDFTPSPMTMSALDTSGMKSIKRATKVPGLQPDNVMKKSKKAFGHPVDT